MRLAFLSVLLPAACLLFCEALPMTTDDNSTSLGTTENSSALKKCCAKLHLSGEDSIFKDIFYCTGKDYKPAKNKGDRRRWCCCCSSKSKKNASPHQDTKQSETSATASTNVPPNNGYASSNPVYSSTSEVSPDAQKSNIVSNEISAATVGYELGKAHANHEAVIANGGVVEGLGSVPSGSGVVVQDAAGSGAATGIQDTGAGDGIDVGAGAAGSGDCGGADVGECLCCMGGVIYKVVKFVVCDVGCCCFQQGCPGSGDCC